MPFTMPPTFTFWPARQFTIPPLPGIEPDEDPFPLMAEAGSEAGAVPLGFSIPFGSSSPYISLNPLKGPAEADLPRGGERGAVGSGLDEAGRDRSSEAAAYVRGSARAAGLAGGGEGDPPGTATFGRGGSEGGRENWLLASG